MKKLIFLYCCFFSSLSAADALQTKLDILELMINDNIENARSEYVKLIQDDNNAKAKTLLIEASKRYESQALKILAFEKYENNDRLEALTLLCSASILGDIGATRDLYLLPKLLNVQDQDVENSCKNASSKMRESLLSLHSQKYLLTRIRNKFHIFEYKRNFLKMSYLDFFNHILSRAEVLTDASYQNFIAVNEKGNVQKLKKLQRENEERNEPQTANWERKIYLDRKANREGGANDVLTHNTSKDMLLIRDELQLKLNGFNQLRASNKKVSTQTLMNLIKESK